MRPACLRNARSLASAPSPLLPFLAPRAFPEAPHVARQDDCKSQKEQEEKKSKERKCFSTGNVGKKAALGVRYADIFSFARHQLRSYSTRREGADVRIRYMGRRVRSKTTNRSALAKSNPGRARRKRAIPRRRIRKVVSVWGRIVPWSAEALQDHAGKTESDPGGSWRQKRRLRPLRISDGRRQRSLKNVEERLGSFLRHHYPHSPGTPKNFFGKYRSFRRRAITYSFRQSQVLVLEKAPLPWTHTMAAFAALDRNTFRTLKRRSYPIILTHHSMCADWSARLFNNGDTAEANQTWRNWNAFDPETRENYWPHLLIYLLDKFPHRALPFLQALTHKPCVESLDVTIIADAFEHLARTYMDKSLRNVSQRYQLQQNEPAFVPTFYHVFREHLSPHTQICSQDLLLCVARLANIEEFERLFDLFRESHACIGKNVLLHYVNIFAKAGDFRQALVCLKMAAGRAKFRPNFINGDKFRWSSALVLHRSMVNRENYHETTGIVATLVDLGLKLDILLYNVIIHNAMKAGDHLTAFKVFNALDANGLKPDVITLSTLLHGCTVMSDSAKHHDFADYCAESAIEMKDAWLAADYLYYQYVRLRRESQEAEERFGRSDEIRRTYLRLFSARPLEPFWTAEFTSPRVNPLSSEDGILSESAFMDPPPMAVYIMLQLEILKAASVSPERLWSLYEKFTELVHTQHDLVLSKLARDPIIWNAFLLAFCRARNFEHASQVVQKMSSYGPSPNVYTWNIFMQGFFKTEQIQAAERVYEIMRARGIAPDQFTYEVLLRGYARAQHVSKIGEVIEHVSQEKQDDPKLLADLARVHDQRRVLYELEKARIRKEERIRLEKEAKEYRDRVRWAPPKFAPLVQPKEAPLDDKAGPRIKPIFAPGSALALQFKSTLKR